MKVKETIDKAYGNVPKEVGMFDVFSDWPRGVKYHWIKLMRALRRI